MDVRYDMNECTNEMLMSNEIIIQEWYTYIRQNLTLFFFLWSRNRNILQFRKIYLLFHFLDDLFIKNLSVYFVYVEIFNINQMHWLIYYWASLNNNNNITDTSFKQNKKRIVILFDRFSEHKIFSEERKSGKWKAESEKRKRERRRRTKKRKSNYLICTFQIKFFRFFYFFSSPCSVIYSFISLMY